MDTQILTALRQDQVNRHRIKNQQTLANYLWTKQPGLNTTVANWLKLWARYHFNGDDKPLPFLHLYGPNNLGKSHLANGIARFFALNFGSLIHSAAPLCSVVWIHWLNYCESQLNGQDVRLPTDASIVVIDDIDSFKPIPKSLSTWALQQAANALKSRAEESVLPTVITGNWEPSDLLSFFATSPEGKSSPETEQMTKTLLSVLQRNAYAQIKFQGQDRRTKTRGYAKIAKAQNDMQALGFMFLQEKFGVEVQF